MIFLTVQSSLLTKKANLVICVTSNEANDDSLFLTALEPILES